jgi:hypothetical protein
LFLLSGGRTGTLGENGGAVVRADLKLLSTIELYEEVLPELYKAVAGILCFIYKVSGRL